MIEAVGEVYRAVDGLTEAPAGTDPDAFLPVIARELFEYLLADHLATRLPGVFWALEGDRRDHIRSRWRPPAGGPSFVRTRFAWEQLPEALSDPAAIPAQTLRLGHLRVRLPPGGGDR